MNRRTTLLAAALLACGLTACGFDYGPFAGTVGSGNVKSESRDVHDFDRVELAGIGTLTITQGSTEALTIKAEDNLLSKIGSVVHGGTLTLAPVSNTYLRPTKPILYDLTVKQLKAIHVSGAGDAAAAGLTADQLDLGVSGSGTLSTSRIMPSTLMVNLSGSGSMTVSGQAARQTVSISGSGRYVASDLASQQAAVDVSGSGSARVTVSDQLRATVSGSGSVTYSGSPRVTQTVSGSGSVTKTG
ncbi:MAG TPA: head GIN domain-containing protein [Terriglobales bacterium]|nr:head GIN domain-containing protein [Terriglobales bacterium]